LLTGSLTVSFIDLVTSAGTAAGLVIGGLFSYLCFNNSSCSVTSSTTGSFSY